MPNCNYFEIFNLPTIFDIDLLKLEEIYIILQKKLHPDNFKSSKKIQQALTGSALINEAHDVLKNNLSRAEHILSLHNVILENEKPNQDLLSMMIEKNEIIDHTTEKENLLKIKKDIEDIESICIKNISESIDKQDIKSATLYTIKLKYLTRLKRASIMKLDVF